MSTPVFRIGDLEINQDLNVQRQMWTIQRVGWAAMALIILLGAAGLFGQGPASQATAGSVTGPLYLEYERFGRYQSSSTLRLHIQAPDEPGPILLWINSAYLAGIEIQQITPSPAKMSAADQGVLVHINTSGRREPSVVTVYFQFHSIGSLAGEIRVSDQASVQFNQFVYP